MFKLDSKNLCELINSSTFAAAKLSIALARRLTIR